MFTMNGGMIQKPIFFFVTMPTPLHSSSSLLPFQQPMFSFLRSFRHVERLLGLTCFGWAFFKLILCCVLTVCILLSMHRFLKHFSFNGKRDLCHNCSHVFTSIDPLWTYIKYETPKLERIYLYGGATYWEVLSTALYQNSMSIQERSRKPPNTIT